MGSSPLYQVRIVSCLDRLGISPPGEAGHEPPGPWVVVLKVRVVTEETMRLGLDGHVGEVLVVLADNAELAVRHSIVFRKYLDMGMDSDVDSFIC